ncbi:2-C-methyl-D-erythritol 4-phosphate cytidylyltransferase [Caldalkalibacillus salinus]|uniref:2-C-methyl-D-erythritol 4-phosphate cytidylyltransferase n=1 Tax=Caldalkalibacillus salinus TaxID=2803787 RepID=UPI003017052E
MSTIGAIICAAGQGKRMGLGHNKQFVELDGIPLLVHTLKRLTQTTMIETFVVVVGHGEVDKVTSLLSQYKLPSGIHVITGGDERQDSVYEGVKHMASLAETPDIVLVHDGARPFIDELDLDRVVNEAQREGAAIFAVPVTDTIKETDQHQHVSQTLDRTKLWAVQTPQAFRYSLLKEGHESAKERHIYMTDDAALVERLDKRVVIVEGSRYNIKLTTPEDLTYAQVLLRMKQEGNRE